MSEKELSNSTMQFLSNLFDTLKNNEQTERIETVDIWKDDHEDVMRYEITVITKGGKKFSSCGCMDL